MNKIVKWGGGIFVLLTLAIPTGLDVSCNWSLY